MAATQKYSLSRILTDITTTAAGDFCSAKIQGHVLLAAFIGFSTYAVLACHKDFDPVLFATGGVAIMGGTAGSQKIKDSTEPQVKEEK